MSVSNTLSTQATTQDASSKAAAVPYLGYLEDFRGLAIFFVVLIHANNAVLQRGVEGIAGRFSWVWTSFHILSHNSTVYFALISGILYAYWLHRKPHSEFLKSRATSVVLPYAIVTVGLTLMLYVLDATRGNVSPNPAEFVQIALYNLLFGEAWNHLWYIPVITVLYVISPALLRLANAPKMRWAVVIIVLLPLIATRTATDVTVQMLIYFTGVYTVGLLIGRDPESSITYLSEIWSQLVVLAFLTAAGIAYLDWAQIDKFGFVSLRESMVYVLRMTLAALMLIALRHSAGRMNPAITKTLKVLALYSFGIYFLHAPLLRPIAKGIGLLMPEGNPGWALSVAVISALCLALAITIAIVKLIKLVAGSRSKYLIGS